MDSNIYISKLESAANELMCLFSTEILFSGNYSPKADEILVANPDLSVFYATSQDIDYKFESIKRGDYSVADAADEKYQYWTGILEKHDKFYSEIETQLQTEDFDFDSLFQKKYDEILQKIRSHPNVKYVPAELIDVTVGIVYSILNQKTFDNELPEFYSNLLRVYSNGGIPCGWKGDFPEGTLLVYNPKP